MGPRRKINFKELPKQLARTVTPSSGAAKPVRYPSRPSLALAALAPTSTYLAKHSIPGSLPKGEPPESDSGKTKYAQLSERGVLCALSSPRGCLDF